MRKLFFICIVLFLESCSKPNDFPEEYRYIMGEWVLDSLTKTTNIGTPYSQSETVCVDSIGYCAKLIISDLKISELIENTIAFESRRIVSIEICDAVFANGDTLKAFHVSYKPLNTLATNSITLYYNSKTDKLSHSYSREQYSQSNTSYLFTFKRQ